MRVGVTSTSRWGWRAHVRHGPSIPLAGGALAVSLGLAACASATLTPSPLVSPDVAPGGGLPSGSLSGALTVYAAASLSGVMDALAERWLASHPGIDVVATLGASNVLATQIVEGAPADVFLSADLERPAQLAAAGLVSGAPVVFAVNRLAIVAAPGDEQVTRATDIARPGVRLVASGPGVPITRYADELVAQLAAITPDPAAFEEAVAANVVSREDNVRAALAKVELGEGDAAIVYATDALASPLVRVVPLPDSVDVTAEYAAVALGDGAAADFVEWLQGPEAAAVLAAAGFGPVPG